MRTNKNCFSPAEEDIKKQSKIIKEESSKLLQILVESFRN